MVQPRANEMFGDYRDSDELNGLAPFRAIWTNTFIAAGGFNQASCCLML